MQSKRISVFLLVVCLVLVTSTYALAGNKPLYLESSNPAYGDRDIPVDLIIDLKFSKNVVNMKVKENNLQCFRLISVTGTVVPVEVIMADDQLYREKRNDIKIKPLTLLDKNTFYTLIIDSSLKAKNGNTLAETIYIPFGTISD